MDSQGAVGGEGEGKRMCELIIVAPASHGSEILVHG
jgi:hypothetical protein